MFSVIYITTSSLGEARFIGRTLVEERLVACANIFPITSIYHWDGLQENEEGALLVKTTTEKVKIIERRIKELHSYDVPCIISLVIDGSEDYLAWIKKELR
ncbi:MAG: divalent-cation tolerance protein CutA [Methanocellales archaeon]|nr:divalent-cation tolerance protein CutA [Methanocellales archaeon]MDD3421110.1 divalent-cation tolerance protein CutA [Methanocellales archaeon]MDD4898368.1 divalent-cation tolerance protein CutA [Methanocellales archaeon]MDD5446728.1 divalent-cation tolerance protein CutA [Methanocellales archaeon]